MSSFSFCQSGSGRVLNRLSMRRSGRILRASASQNHRVLRPALSSLRFLDRDQASRIAGFRSPSRAKTRLLALVRASHLDHFFVGTVPGGRKAIYCLPGLRRNRGPTLLASPHTERFVEHQLWINELYLILAESIDAKLVRWERLTAAIPDSSGVIPDGYAEIKIGGERHGMFLEVDLGTESLVVWEKKVRGYLHLARSGMVEQQFDLPSFLVLVVAKTEGRIEAIRSVIAKSTDKVFWLANTESIKREGFWSAIWLRPTGDRERSLI
jgi:hypothetical protein